MINVRKEQMYKFYKGWAFICNMLTCMKQCGQTKHYFKFPNPCLQTFIQICIKLSFKCLEEIEGKNEESDRLFPLFIPG